MSLTQHLADFYEVMVLMCCFGLHRTTQKHHKPLKYYKTHISCEKFYLLEIHIYIYIDIFIIFVAIRKKNPRVGGTTRPRTYLCNGKVLELDG